MMVPTNIRHKKRVCVVLMGLFLLSSLVSACRTPPDAAELVSSQQVQLAGRDFVLDVLALEVTPRAYVLSISGDGISISIDGGAAGDTPVVTGNTIRFAGHVLEVLSAPQQFRIDGTAYTLSPPGLYTFSQHGFFGQVQ
jgi:hypothetical protein